MSIRARTRGGERVLYVSVKVRLPDGRVVRKEVRAPVQTKRDAREYEVQLRRALLDGSYGRDDKRLRDFWPDVERWNQNNTKPSHAKAVEIAFRLHILPALGALRLSEVGAAEVESLKARLLKTKAPKTVNNTLGYLHRALTLAVEWGQLDVAPGAGLLELDEVEAEWLDRDEAERFLEAARAGWPERYPLLVLLLDTGLRIGEALGLRWRDVDLQGRVLVVRRTRVAVAANFGSPKEGRSRQVQLTSRAAFALGMHRHLRELVFTTPQGKPLTHAMVRDWVPDAMRRAGLAKSLTAHGLRHTCTAHLVMAGVDEATIMAQLGWETPAMLRRYAHLSPRHRRAAVDALEAFRNTKTTKEEAG